MDPHISNQLIKNVGKKRETRETPSVGAFRPFLRKSRKIPSDAVMGESVNYSLPPLCFTPEKVLHIPLHGGRVTGKWLQSPRNFEEGQAEVQMTLCLQGNI